MFFFLLHWEYSETCFDSINFCDRNRRVFGLYRFNKFRPNLLGINFCIRNRQVFGLYRLNQQRFPTLKLYLKSGLFCVRFRHVLTYLHFPYMFLTIFIPTTFKCQGLSPPDIDILRWKVVDILTFSCSSMFSNQLWFSKLHVFKVDYKIKKLNTVGVLYKYLPQGSTLTVVRLPGSSEMRLHASENDSVICSIPEEQND